MLSIFRFSIHSELVIVESFFGSVSQFELANANTLSLGIDLGRLIELNLVFKYGNFRIIGFDQSLYSLNLLIKHVYKAKMKVRSEKKKRKFFETYLRVSRAF